MLSGKQQKIFQRIKLAAWLEICRRDPMLDAEDKIALDKWYRNELLKGIGTWSTKQIAQNDHTLFDKLCLHFARLSNDAAEIAYWSAAEERKLLWRIRQLMLNLRLSEAYLLGILKRMGFSQDVEELPAEHLRKVLSALTYQSKRVEK